MAKWELIGKGGVKDLARIRELEGKIASGERWGLVLDFKVKIPSFIAERLRHEFQIRNLNFHIEARDSRIVITGEKESPGPWLAVAVLLGLGFIMGFLSAWFLFRMPKTGLAILGGAGVLFILLLLLLGRRR